jgi:mRNA interferase RelE/StbE
VYKIVFTKQAVKSLQRIPRNITDLIREKLAQLAADPFAKHLNVTKLQNRPGNRLRVGDWRVIYEIQKEQLVVMVLKVAPRGEVYR